MAMLCDYSGRGINPHDLAAAGFSGAFRYLTGPNALTRGEADLLAAAGILIGGVAEHGAQDMLYPNLWTGYGEQAAAIYSACGAPEWAPIWYPADFDVQGVAQVDAVLESLHNAQAAAHPYPAGMYGGVTACAAAAYVGIRWLWQTSAWSYGKRQSGIVVLQTGQSKVIDGVQIDVDLDEGVLAEHGLWVPGMPNPAVLTPQLVLSQYGPTWYTRYGFAPPPPGMTSIPEVTQGKVYGEHFVPVG